MFALRNTIEELIPLLDARVNGTTSYLLTNGPECFTEQKHTREEGTPERIYLHYGNMTEVRDVLTQLNRIQGTPNVRSE